MVKVTCILAQHQVVTINMILLPAHCNTSLTHHHLNHLNNNNYTYSFKKTDLSGLRKISSLPSLVSSGQALPGYITDETRDFPCKYNLEFKVNINDLMFVTFKGPECAIPPTPSTSVPLHSKRSFVYIK